METPDPPNATPAALKQVVLTSHDIPRILRVFPFSEVFFSKVGFLDGRVFRFPMIINGWRQAEELGLSLNEATYEILAHMALR